MDRRFRIALLTFLLVSLFPIAEPVQAASLIVNSLADTNDGACTTDPGGCTLREAITVANSNGVPDTITFSVSGTIYIRDSGLPPLIEGNTTIDAGTNHTVVLSGEQLRDSSNNIIPAHGIV
ncbi:MAG: CSLREA domain-containing protein, partial [Chloroflexus sp.]|nr:CSLREA domain-containing protein [Chloroflexus sp.]